MSFAPAVVLTRLRDDGAGDQVALRRHQGVDLVDAGLEVVELVLGDRRPPGLVVLPVRVALRVRDSQI